MKSKLKKIIKELMKKEYCKAVIKSEGHVNKFFAMHLS